MKDLQKIPIIGFAGVGLLSTVLDFLVLNGLRLVGVSALGSVAGGFLCGAVNGYLLNSHYVFKRDKNWQRFSKYLFSSLIGFFLTEAIIYLLHVQNNWLALNPAKVIAVVVVFFWNYMASQVWAFK